MSKKQQFFHDILKFSVVSNQNAAILDFPENVALLFFCFCFKLIKIWF